MSNAVIEKDNQNVTSMLMSSNFKQQIAMAMPKHMNADRMLRIALTELRKTPSLQQCNKLSFLGAIMQAAQLGLEPGSALGHCYLLPYKNEVQIIIGFKGLIELARRSGQIKSIAARCVYANDTFNFAYGFEETINHVPADGDRGELTHVYAVAKLADGGRQMEVMSAHEVNKVRQSSAKSDGKPWAQHFDEMARKTVIRRLAKYLPLSSEMVDALNLDNQAFDDEPQNLHKLIDKDYEIPAPKIDVKKGEIERLEGGKHHMEFTHEKKAREQLEALEKSNAIRSFQAKVKASKEAGRDPEKILGRKIPDILSGHIDQIDAMADLLENHREMQS